MSHCDDTLRLERKTQMNRLDVKVIHILLLFVLWSTSVLVSGCRDDESGSDRIDLDMIKIEAVGMALYQGYGAWLRIQEMAIELKDKERIKEAREAITFAESGLQEWHSLPRVAGLDLTKYKEAKEKAYQQTDESIRNGDDPQRHLNKIE